MGGRVAGYEDTGEVFLRGRISGYRGGSYQTLQELDSTSLLPRSESGRDNKLSRYGQLFNYRILCGLLGDGVRPAREEV
jgi:hypothetical protein